MKRGILLILILSLCLQTAIVPPGYATEEEAVTVTSEARVLKGGDRGDDVRALQERLRALKYLDAKATGNYLNQRTRNINGQAAGPQEALGVRGIDGPHRVRDRAGNGPFGSRTVAMARNHGCAVV